MQTVRPCRSQRERVGGEQAIPGERAARGCWRPRGAAVQVLTRRTARRHQRGETTETLARRARRRRQPFYLRRLVYCLRSVPTAEKEALSPRHLPAREC